MIGLRVSMLRLRVRVRTLGLGLELTRYGWS